VPTPSSEILAESHRDRLAVTPDAHALDERTCADLDLDAVFSKIDRTSSTLGRQALYHRLRVVPGVPQLEAFESLVTRFSDDARLEDRARRALARLQDPHGYNLWWMGRPGAIDSRAWYGVFPLLTAAAIASVAVIPISLTPVVVMLIINLAVNAVSTQHIGQITRSFRQLAPIIATAQALRFLTGDDIDPIVRPLAKDVSGLRRLKLLSRWSNDNLLMLPHTANPLAVMLNDFLSVVYQYINTLFLLDASGVFFGVNDLRRNAAALLRVVEAVGDVDAAMSVAAFRQAQPLWTRPKFTDDDNVVAVDLCHPLLEQPVANSIALSLGTGMLVTGSNMSGKSTFLRTVGVNAVLAQTIHTCIAREYRAPRLRVRSSIGRKDDLLSGKSYYVVEVEALVDLLQSSESGEPHLILLDELFHGTNTIERIAAADAVLHSLVWGGSSRKPHIVIAATHDLELTTLLAGFYEAYHFGDAIGPDGPVFDHRLTTGASTNRTALALLRQKGAAELLLERASATANQLDTTRSGA
jgi:hypothetical protein